MDSAAAMIEKAILANPSYAEAYNNLGMLAVYFFQTITFMSLSMVCDVGVSNYTINHSSLIFNDVAHVCLLGAIMNLILGTTSTLYWW